MRACVLTIISHDLKNGHGRIKWPYKLERRLRYREALLARRPGLHANARVIVDWEGTPVEADALAAHLAHLRSVRINMEFNGALCRGLKRTRYQELETIEGEPTLVDFILDRVPPSQTAGCPTRR